MESRKNIFGIAAAAAAVLLVAALLKRRFRLGFFLLPVTVALAEKWRDQRDRERIHDATSPSPEDP